MAKGRRYKKTNQPKTHNLSAALKRNVTVLPVKWTVRARKRAHGEERGSGGVWSMSTQGTWHLGSRGRQKSSPASVRVRAPHQDDRHSV